MCLYMRPRSVCSRDGRSPRAAVKSGRASAESLLSDPQRKAIGNLGGQSTSNNVSVCLCMVGFTVSRSHTLQVYLHHNLHTYSSSFTNFFFFFLVFEHVVYLHPAPKP